VRSALLTPKGNYFAERQIQLDVEYDEASSSAEYTIVSDVAKVDARPRPAVTRAKRTRLFGDVMANPLLRSEPTISGVARQLVGLYPERYQSEDAARKAFQRARDAAGGVYVQDRGWIVPDAA
jgi:hypothetical protein